MVKIGNKIIGDGHPCFITFEAGPTHDSLASAKRLVTMTKEAGADAIKFQIFKPDNLIADRNLMFCYKVLLDKESGATEEITEPLYDILCRRYLTDDEWFEVKHYADSLGLAFFATICDDEDLELVTSLNCHSIKIASADVNHLPFIRRVARTGLCIQLDTGMATFGEIEEAIDAIRREGNENIIVHNCPSGYPARLESINLRMIPVLKSTFECPIAYSDHTPGWDMDIAALAIGANLLEKTITENRCTRSVEHIMSLEPLEMRSFIQAVRDVEIAMGHPRRILTEEERKRRMDYRRSVYLEESVTKGQRLGDIAVSFRRPGYGLSPDEYEKLLDACFREDLRAGMMVGLEHLLSR